MSFRAKRELLAQVSCRYREASHLQKSVILDEFIAATGYARKYATRVLGQPPVLPAPRIQRRRERQYGPSVREALVAAWAATNYICAKRLVPFLAELIPVLERHGHLALAEEDRLLLLAISPATVDRILRPLREKASPRGVTTTRKGRLLKHQVTVRTFSEWDDLRPGFLEADLVAHCGFHTDGAFLQTLVLTDIATGWTECLALLHRSQENVLHALDVAGRLLPFPVLGLDTDNGTEFLNEQLLAYCRRESITFTRGRAHKKNDQCFVEQKNGSVVRQLVGYDRYEGQRAYRQLAELYRAVRLYVNFFQPSMKLLTKTRHGAKVNRQYDTAQTPYQRLVTSGMLPKEVSDRLEQIYGELDPVRLLRQLERLQDALWKHAVLPAPRGAEQEAAKWTADKIVPNPAAKQVGPATATLTVIAPAASQERTRRKYRRSEKPRAPRTWRTHPDAFAPVWEEVSGWLAVEPERTAKSVFEQLQQQHPGRFPDGQLRTLQRRVKEWRARAILEFDAAWLAEEVTTGLGYAGRLRASLKAADPCVAGSSGEEGAAVAA
jgi:hypothetical protein